MQLLKSDKKNYTQFFKYENYLQIEAQMFLNIRQNEVQKVLMFLNFRQFEARGVLIKVFLKTLSVVDASV